MIVFGIIGVAVLIGVGSYFAIQGNSNFDIESDYSEIKKALLLFKRDNIGLTKGIENLQDFLKPESNVRLDRYIMSIDDRFLLVKRLPKQAVPNDILRKIGGKSTYKDGVLKLSFYTSPNDIEPYAEILIKPMRKITTTTKLEYSHEKSKVVDNKIKEVEWVNNNEYFDTKGTYTIKLRVQDKNSRWSKWASKEIFVSEERGVNSICAGGEHLFVLHNNGKVEAYGENDHGQLGNGTNRKNKLITKVDKIIRVDEIATSSLHTLFLKSDRTVSATGFNDSGQLGKGDRMDCKLPVATWGMSNIIQVECGEGFSAAVTSDGFVYTWGNNINQCLGHNIKNFVETPMKVEDVTNVKQVSLGSNFMLALSHDGTVFSWGENDYGQLGLGFKSKSQGPAVSTLKGIKYVQAGKGFGYALDNNGKVIGFGLNEINQLGFEGEKEVLFPREMSKLKDIIKIVTKNNFTVALDATGRIYSWGQFLSLQQKYALVPTRSEELLYIKDITASATHGYVLTEDDEVYEFTSGFKGLVKIEVDKSIEVMNDEVKDGWDES